MPSSTKKKKGRRRRAAHPSDLKPNGKRRNILWRWRRGLFLLGLLLVAGVAGLGYSLAQIKLPPERLQAQTSFICAADVSANCNDSNAIASLHGEQDRVNVTLDQVPQVVVDAVLAAEDRTFFDHGGVDPWGTARALWADLRNQGGTQGGSTITQQYVKNVYLTSERTLSRKIKEAVLSIKLEQEFSKQQILERYLNTVYFGRGAYGIGAAVRTYFGHDLSKVTLPEAAYLAGLIRSPETADGAKPEQTNLAITRRRSVLQGMLETKKIDQAQFDVADKTPFVVGAAGDPTTTILARPPDQKGFGPVQRADIGTEYFRDYVVQQLKQHGLDEAKLFGGGLRVYTTLDLDKQQKAYDAVTSTLTSPDDPLSALVSLDPDGHIIAMIGGRDHSTDENNYAAPGLGAGGRHAGSSFKPFVLAEAVKQGISLQSQFESPSEIVLPKANAGKDWDVHNAEASSGVLNLLDATKHSSNTVFAQLMLKVHPQNVIPLATQMGITTPLPEVNSLVLGTGDVFPLDMASGYSTFAHRGTHIQPTGITKVEVPNGSGGYDTITFDQPQTNPLTKQESDLVTFALQGVVHGGTGSGAFFGKPIAGKTGTTEDNKDAWFVGFTPNGYSTAVWMGYRNAPEDGPARYMTSVHGRVVFGGTFPATIWNKYMKSITSGMDVGDFSNPSTFPGKVLNGDLTTTSSTDTTLPDTTTTNPASTTTETTNPDKTTTTIEPPTSTTALPN
ncbi:MAG: penicillin-binding protein [Acidimicrobiaceae bacterium]|jgi:penicillin-binding protein 1A